MVLRTYLQVHINQGMVLQFRSALFRHAQRLSLAIHDKRTASDFTHRINYSARSLGSAPALIPSLLQSVVTLVGMLVITFLIDPALALLSLVVVPFLVLSMRYYSRGIQPRLEQVRNSEVEALSIVQETLSMLRVIVSFGREDHEHAKFSAQSRRSVDARIRVTVSQTMFSFYVNIITAAGTALVLGYGAYQVLEGHLSLGQLLVVLAYIAAVYQPLNSLVSAATPMHEYIVNLRAAFELLDETPTIVDAPGAVAIDRGPRRVEFDHVTFAHHGRSSTLADLTFTAEPGQVTAIVGPTGAGKTTMMALLSRLYDPEIGVVKLDGRDIRGITLKSLREQFSVVLQDTLLFSASIRENIAYGDLEADEYSVAMAADAAGAHDFIAALPDGYETVVGEGGRGLSGGERQRIDDRARVPARRAGPYPRRADLGHRQRDRGRHPRRARPTHVRPHDVHHRPPPVHGPSRGPGHLVMDHGRIVERGSHAQLLALGGQYARLHAVQAGSRDGEPGRGHAPAASLARSGLALGPS